jgi:hypothetical protein
MPYWPQALSVTLRFVLWFLILPYALMPKHFHFADRLAFGFGLFAVGGILFMQALSALQLYDPFALWALLLLVIVLYLTRWRKRSGSWDRSWVAMLDGWEERRGTLLQMGAGIVRKGGRGLKQGMLRFIGHPYAIAMVAGLTAFAWGVWLRFAPYLQKAYLGVADGYVHLTWMKYLERYALFHDGLYPHGYHAFAGALGSLTSLDRFLLFRFIGPIGGVLLAASVGYAAFRLRLRVGGILLAFGLFALSPGSPFPVEAFRQSHPLPQEFAAIFVLPTVVLGWEYLRSGERKWGVGSIVSALGAFGVHPYTVTYVLPAILLYIASEWAGGRRLSVKRVLTLLTGISAALLIAVLPLIGGYLAGKPWHGTFTMGVGPVQPVPQFQFVSSNLFINGSLFLAVWLLVWGVKGLKTDERGSAAVTLGTLLLITATQVGGLFGIPLFLELNAVRLAFGLFFCLALGLAFDRSVERLKAERIAPVIAALLLVAQVVQWRPVPNKSVQSEYEDAVKVFIAITENYPKLHWTMVGPVEQYSQVLNVGWHEELGHFLLELRGHDVTAPDYKWYIPTPDIFVYVEKVPLHYNRLIEPDAEAPVNFDGLLDPNTLYQRYQVPEQRALMEARVWGIMEKYAAAHPDKATIFFESPELRVYQIKHKPEIK